MIRLLSFAVGVSLAGSFAQAGLPANCHERFESELSRRAASIQEALNEKGGRAVNRMQNLRSSVTEMMSYIQGNWAADCSKAAPGNEEKLNALIAKIAQKPVDQAKVAYHTVCRERGEELVAENREHIRRAENNGSSSAKAGWETLIASVKALNCQGHDKRISELEKEMASAGAGYQKADAVDQTKRVCPSVVRELKAANAALAGGAQSTEEAPAIIAQGSADFKNLVKLCGEGLSKLRAAGFSDSQEAYRIEPPTGLPKDVKVEVVAAKIGEVDSLLKKNSDLDSLSAKAKAHNTRIQTQVRAEWIKTNVVSPDQKSVFEAHRSLIPRQKKMAGSTVWTYWSKLTDRYWADCEEVTFDSSGKMAGRRTYLCN